MHSVLLVPMYLDALCLTKSTGIREALIDYSGLPFTYEQGGSPQVHPSRETPNLSENILSPPFTSSILELPPGIHLHWALPDTLTHSDEGDSAGNRKFPIVPNRWLIIRRRNGNIENQWVVESDYLHPDLSILSAQLPDAVTVPFSQINPTSGPYQPFRHMGRKVPQASWTQNDPNAEYLKQYGLALTSVGPFDWVNTLDHIKSSFAAFYPNCFSVFGFRDDDPSAYTNPQGLAYDVIGWYGDPSQDFMGLWYTQNPDKNDSQQMVEELNEELDWNVDVGAQSFPDRTVCYARLTFQNGPRDNPDATARNVSLSVGNTGTEALSAYLAQTLAPANKSVFEEQLEAMQFINELEQQKLDQRARLFELRHQKGFTGVFGGVTWSIRSGKPGSKSRKPGLQITLPDSLADQLNELNELQEQYDEAQEAIGSMSERLFRDWYKYQICRHPEGFEEEKWPGNLEDAFWTVFMSGIPPMRTSITQTGQLQWSRDPNTGLLDVQTTSVGFGIVSKDISYYSDYENDLLQGNLTNSDTWFGELENCGIKLSSNAIVVQPPGGISGGDEGKVWQIQDGSTTYLVKVEQGQMNLYIPPLPDQLATRLAQAVSNLRTAATSVSPDYTLGPVPHSRYWHANEPVVLMVGDTVLPTDRHGEDGSDSDDGLLPCLLLPNVDDAALQDLPHHSELVDQIRQLMDNQQPSPGTDTAGFSWWTQQPWNPAILEWEVQFFPDTVVNGNYPTDYVTSRYTLPQTAVDLSPTQQDISSDERPYRGFSLLSSHAGEKLKQWIADYLVTQCAVLPPPLDTELKGLTVEQAVTLLDAQDLTATLASYQPKGDNDPIVTALSSYNALKTLPCLSQALGGFNDALLTQQRIMQLPIGDPTGDDDDMQLALQVQGTVRNGLLSAPLPNNDFTPIRSGEMRISALRLVDTFGQVNDLQVDPSAGCVISSTEQMPLRYPTSDDCRIRLLPRLAQAARVSFRWLSAEPVNGNDEAEMNAHPATSPICGWVLPNNLDNSLMIYEADGGLLGLVDSEGRWRSAPGRLHVIDVASIQNPHLRAMVQYMTSNLTSGEAFTTSFLSTLDDAIQNINPEDYAQHKAMALLVGRPLALVRASVSIELKGQPARDEGWDLFLNEVQAYHENGTVTPVTESPDSITQAFQGVRLPIRIGEFSQYNDGLAGYWLEDGQGGYAGNVFYAPQSDNEGLATASGEPRSIQTAKNAPVDVLHAPGEAPKTLALLVDPRGRVHATSGVLPTKAIGVPSDQYAGAIAALEVTFLSAPLMTPRATYEQPPDQQQLQAALPQEGGYAWSWLNNLGGNWLESANFTPPDTTARFAGEQLLCEGWLKLSSTETSGNGTRE
ncbi:hypothetical protein JRI60_23330 [Archangium violaceum]|uniref:hypothetical protein n=1 Tax=Archangium violaceum TaxID=83451 RepID=UPI0019505305|nr:hypothetical protein [Archangium violaceum]QRO01746.1 hypothetical protein JRI60_23330 [Archangium violaceum]